VGDLRYDVIGNAGAVAGGPCDTPERLYQESPQTADIFRCGAPTGTQRALWPSLGSHATIALVARRC